MIAWARETQSSDSKISSSVLTYIYIYIYICMYVYRVSQKNVYTLLLVLFIWTCCRIPSCQAFEVFEDDENFCFQQDGAPPYYHHNVRAYLDEHLPNRWIARRGSIEYHPRSPDLAPMNFFLCGHLKDNVYRAKPATINEIKAVISEVYADAIFRQL